LLTQEPHLAKYGGGIPKNDNFLLESKVAKLSIIAWQNGFRKPQETWVDAIWRQILKSKY
jgi:hypothetical protein